VAANTVTLTFKIAEDGSLKALGQDADKTAGKLDKAGKSTDRYNKGQKGVAQAGMNGTKAFSKMRNEIGGGGSGLVGAYAGLAANIFALTATFGALSRAARATQLEEGLVAMGKASGLAMNSLSQGLVSATGNAVSLEEAMRSVALITSAGIDPSSIERFGEVAKKAAGALGRDVNDSISRLTRGVTKLEPELLDELGIMVRLDEASKTYADSLGKNVSELTSFQKRQAFLNATLTEGEKKFGALGDVDVNPYDKLSASFANITKSGIGGLASILAPIVGYLASSPVALIGVLAAFAATISGQVLGSLTDMSAATARNSKNMVKLNADTLRSLKPMNLSSRSLDNVVLSMRDGNVASKEYSAAMNGQIQSQRTNLGLLTKRQKLETDGVAITDSTGKALKKTGISQDQYNKRIKNSRKIMSGLNIAQSQGRNSSAQLAAAKAQAALAEGRYGVALKNTKRALMLQINALKIAKREVTTYAGAMNLARIAASGLAMAAKTAGAAIMSMMGVVGMAVMAIMMLVDGVKALINYFKSDAYKAYEEQVAKIAEVTKELSENVKEVNQFFEDGSGKITSVTGAYTALHNILSTFDSSYQKLKSSGEGFNGSIKQQRKAMLDLIGTSGMLNQKVKEKTGLDDLEAATARFRTVEGKANILLIEETITALKLEAEVIRSVAEAFKNAKEPLTDFINKNAIKTEIDAVVGGIQEIRDSLLTTDKTGKIKMIPILDESGDISKVLQDVLTTDTAVLFNVVAEKELLDTLFADQKTTQKAIAKERTRFNKLGWQGTARGQKAHNALILELNTQLATETAKIETEGGAATQRITAAIQLTTDLFVVEQKRLQLSKLEIGNAKHSLSLAQIEKSNTVASLNAQQDAQDALTAAKTADAQGRLAFLSDEESRLKKSGKEDKATKDRLLVLGQQINAVNNETLILIAESLTLTEREVNLQKTLLASGKEDENVAKAVLNIEKKINKQKSFRLSQDIKIAKLGQSIANRKAGLDSKLLPSQIALIEQDDEVLKRKVRGLILEAKTKKSSLKLEQTMAKLNLNVLKAEAQNINAKRVDAGLTGDALIDLSGLDAVMTGLSDTYTSLIDDIDEGLALGVELLAEQSNTTSIISMQTKERLQKEIEVNEIKKGQLASEKGILGEQQKQFDIRQSIKEISNKDSAGNIKSVRESAKLSQENRAAELVFAQAQEALTRKTLKAESALLAAKWNLMYAEMAASGGQITEQEAAVLNASRTAMRLQQDLNDSKIETAELETKLTADRIAMEESAAHSAAGKAGGFAGAISSIFGTAAAGSVEGAVKGAQTTEEKEIIAHRTTTEDKANLIRNEANTIAKENGMTLKSIAVKLGAGIPAPAPAPEAPAPTTVDTGQGTDDAAVVTNPDAAVVKDPDASTTEGGGASSGLDATTASAANAALTMGELRGTLQGAARDMALLGPDGEGVSQMLLGADAMAAAFEMEGSAADKIGAGLGALSQIVGGAAQNKVNSIDKEIAAEQKRDGKSAASIAKIKALEKKKEQVERKAFNIKKKLSMASVVISTAQAIMESAPNIPKMAFFGAMGAMQLAVISGTSYQGGSGSGAGVSAAPSEISVGERSNTVDLANGNNSSGELAYMRGAQGTGNASDFKPTGAFSGYKNRASGGYIVGEQGPEIFMPEVPGDIIPSGKGMGGATNVTFQISTVDSSGVEDLLSAQRGTIIGMIREAANEHGEFFLESVDERSYTQ
jgi:hypothetical protein